MKFLNKYSNYILLSLAAFLLIAAGTSDNVFTLGDKTTSEKLLKFGFNGNNQMRVPVGGGDLEFSNDAGINFSKLGSGSGGGGGINVLQDSNPDFEAGVAAWTVSGGTFVEESVAPIFGSKSVKWDSNASGQFLDSTLVQIPQGFVGNKCQASLEIRWPTGVANDIKVIARHFDNSLTTEFDVSVINLSPTIGSNVVSVSLPEFDCPVDVADSLRFRLESVSANPAEITIDSIFLGSRNKRINISQTELVTFARYPATVGCNWDRTSGVFGDFLPTVACPSIDVISSTQSVSIVDNDLPDLIFNSLLPGIYTIEVQTNIKSSVIGAVHGIRITDGLTNGPSCTNTQDPSLNTKTDSISCKATFTYNTTGVRSFKIQGFSLLAGIVTLLQDSTAGFGDLTWKVTRYPLKSIQVNTFETIGEHWDVNLGGANIDLGVANITTYAEATNPGLDMVINPGSKTAEVPCSTANPSTGLTCSVGNESVGIVIDISESGRYKACAQFGHFLDDNSAINATTVSTTWQWVETPNNAQTINQESKGYQSDIFDSGSVGFTGGMGFAVSVCGNFTFNSVGKKTLRIMREHAITGILGSQLILADRFLSAGQRDIHITVEKMDEQKPAPVFPELQNLVKAGLTGLKLCAFSIENTLGTPSIISNESCVSSLIDNGVGDVSVNFSTNFYSQTPYCVVGSTEGAFGKNCTAHSTTTILTRVACSVSNLGTAQDNDFSGICLGQK